MSGDEPDRATGQSDQAQSAAPPRTKLILVLFPDETRVDEGVAAIRKTSAEKRPRIYASAAIARHLDGTNSVETIVEEGHGVAATGALIGALAGATAGALGAALGGTGGAVLGRFAERLNKQAFAQFADKSSNELAHGQHGIVAEVAEEDVSSFAALMQAVGGTARA